MSRCIKLALRLIAPSLLLTISSQTVLADEQAKDPAVGFVNEWHGDIGVGGGLEPAYPGASYKRVVAAPSINVSFNRFFIGTIDGTMAVPFGAGVYLYKDARWTAAVAVSYDIFKMRAVSSDARLLHGMGDIGRTARATASGSYTDDMFSYHVAVTTDIGGKDQGTVILAGIDTQIPITSKLSIFMGPSIYWNSSQANQTYYGVNSTQSAASGYTQYQPKAGVSAYSFAVGLEYAFTEAWTGGVRTSISYLPPNVSNSPVVATKTPISVDLYANYHF